MWFSRISKKAKKNFQGVNLNDPLFQRHHILCIALDPEIRCTDHASVYDVMRGSSIPTDTRTVGETVARRWSDFRKRDKDISEHMMNKEYRRLLCLNDRAVNALREFRFGVADVLRTISVRVDHAHSQKQAPDDSSGKRKAWDYDPDVGSFHIIKRQRITAETVQQPNWTSNDGVVALLSKWITGWDWWALTATCKNLRSYANINTEFVVVIKRAQTAPENENDPGAPCKKVTRQAKLPVGITRLEIDVSVQSIQGKLLGTLPNTLRGLVFHTVKAAWLKSVSVLPEHLEDMEIFQGRISAHLVKLINTAKELKVLRFGHVKWLWNEIDIRFPCSLKSLDMGETFNVSLGRALCHLTELEYLDLGGLFNKYVENGQLPKNLKHLIFGTAFNQTLKHLNFPPNLETLKFHMNTYERRMTEWKLPKTLKLLDFFGSGYTTEEFSLPPNLEELRVCEWTAKNGSNWHLPRGLRVKIGHFSEVRCDRDQNLRQLYLSVRSHARECVLAS